ncbi:MAG: M23 family metallopeptidase [Clostridiales bacterium]|nr:M23 family metallopeptidase [Clostridiales bacterium]
MQKGKVLILKDKTTKAKETGKNTGAVLAVQSIVCAVIVLTVFILGKAGSPAFEELQRIYAQKIGRDIYSASVASAMKSFKNYIFDDAPAIIPKTEAEEEKTEAQSTAETSADTEGGKGGEDIEQSEVGSKIFPLGSGIKFTVPVYGKITSPFGQRIHPITGKNSFHTGVDIGAKTGAKIACARDGKVEATGSNNSAGNYILIDHGNGLKTYYCHCSKVYAPQGAVVREGEIIALVGDTGQTTGPHLHFEIRYNGERYDPASVIDFNDPEI